jgi:hypothetical protein
MTARSFEVDSLDGFRDACRDVFLTCSGLGVVTLPCASPQPWNDARFVPTFTAPNTPSYVQPKWQFSAYPKWSPGPGGNHFKGLVIYVTVPDATMGGKNQRVEIDSVIGLGDVIDSLEAARVRFLGECSHRNSVHVRNLGRCYNEYRCTDCGLVFTIDSGD